MKYEELQKLINEQIKNAKIFVLENPKAPLSKNNPKYWNGSYSPWKLEPRHIAIKLKKTVHALESEITSSENMELIDLWNDYKLFRIEVMFHNDRFATIRKELAEFKLKIFDKRETTIDRIILKETTFEEVELLEKIEELEKKLKDKK